MNERTPEDILVAYLKRVSRAEYDYLPEMIEARINEELRLNIAEFIRREKAEKDTTDHYHEVRLELYVATPKQFWEIVNREAEKIALRYRRD